MLYGTFIRFHIHYNDLISLRINYFFNYCSLIAFLTDDFFHRFAVVGSLVFSSQKYGTSSRFILYTKGMIRYELFFNESGLRKGPISLGRQPLVQNYLLVLILYAVTSQACSISALCSRLHHDQAACFLQCVLSLCQQFKECFINIVITRPKFLLPQHFITGKLIQIICSCQP